MECTRTISVDRRCLIPGDVRFAALPTVTKRTSCPCCNCEGFGVAAIQLTEPGLPGGSARRLSPGITRASDRRMLSSVTGAILLMGAYGNSPLRTLIVGKHARSEERRVGKEGVSKCRTR